MDEVSRRELLKRGLVGLAVMGTGGLFLRAEEEPTEPNGDLGAYGEYLRQKSPPRNAENGGRAGWAPTEDNILGPFHRKGAPYRSKISPPLAAGAPLLIRGRVWGHDTKKPLPDTQIDIWQADHGGKYDDGGRGGESFRCRARLITDENGYYEYETIRPGRYRIGRRTWRPSHIHYWVRRSGYKQLITQLYFRGDPHNDGDPFIKKSLIIDLKEEKGETGPYQTGTFDIVLPPGK